VENKADAVEDVVAEVVGMEDSTATGRNTASHCVSIRLLRCVGRQEERGSTQVSDTLANIYLLHARL
jgi:hypothetical protein